MVIWYFWNRTSLIVLLLAYWLIYVITIYPLWILGFHVHMKVMVDWESRCFVFRFFISDHDLADLGQFEIQHWWSILNWLIDWFMCPNGSNGNLRIKTFLSFYVVYLSMNELVCNNLMNCTLGKSAGKLIGSLVDWFVFVIHFLISGFTSFEFVNSCLASFDMNFACFNWSYAYYCLY